MTHLRERDWRTLLHGIGRLHEHEEPTELAATMLDVARELVDCDHSSYDEVDLVNRTTAGFCSDPAVDGEWPRLQRAAAAYFHEHPVLQFFRQQPQAGARRISDFIVPERFREGGLYRECYRHIGVAHQLVMRLPGEAGTEVGLALNRSSHDFSERDRQCLDLLRPHLHRAYHRCLASKRLRERIVGAELAVDSISQGAIVLDPHGRVLLCSPQAERHLARYLPHEPLSATRLPETLERWFERVRATPAAAPGAANPLLIDGADGRLAVTAVRRRGGEAWVLCLSEESVEASIGTLQRLNLSPRQAQVLYWVAQGKSNAEIAFILKVSPRTVQKHLEHVFQLLDVPSRTLATVKAMEAINRWR